jgi:FkbM family methyltransferase
MRKNILKAFYDAIPFKPSLFTVLKYFKLPEKVFRHLHFKGIINVPLEKNKSFKMMHYGFQIENEIFWSGITGGWEKDSLKIWIELCKRSSVIFDIGANTGIYALIAKCINKTNTVYAFEPVERVFEKLSFNNKINHYDIKCLPLAASNFTGSAQIYDTDTEHIYSVTVNKDLSHSKIPTHEVTIQTITLDDLIKKENIAKIDLIKLDVETHEAEVLEGYKQHFAKHKPTILIEILNDTVAQRIESILEECNLKYLYYNINEKGSIRKVDKLSRSDYFNFLLCDAETSKQIGLEG